MSLLKLKIGNKVYLAKYESPKPTVTIGGRKYPIVQIGRQWWMAENLDWKWDGLTYGSTAWSDTEPYANYYNNDNDTYGENGLRYGLLYNKPAEQYFVDNFQPALDGWHVPSVSEWDSLFNKLGGRSKAGISIKSITGWSGVNGNGDTQFNAVPSGLRSGAYYEIGSKGPMFTTEVDGTGMPTYVSPDNIYNRINSSTYGKSNQFAIRLCKDATVNIGGRDYSTTRIGNQVWLAENLDLTWDGLVTDQQLDGTSETPNAVYYQMDEITYGWNGRRCGLLYNQAAKNYLINSVLPKVAKGWHVPSQDDVALLKTFIDDDGNAGYKCSIPVSWAASWNGSDIYGFSMKPSGQRYQGIGEWHCIGEQFVSHTSEYKQYFCRDYDHNTIDTGITSSLPLYSIRLVKDAT